MGELWVKNGVGGKGEFERGGKVRTGSIWGDWGL